MPKYCCKSNVGLTNDSSMSLLLNVVAAKTKPSHGWPAAVNNGKCCKDDNSCSCKGTAGPLNKTNIYRNKQIYQSLKNCKC